MRNAFLLCVLWVVAVLVLVPVVHAEIQITAEPLGGHSQTFNQITSLTFDAAPKGEGIQRIGIDAPIGTQISFTVYYGNNSQASGTLAYTNTIVDPLTGTGYVNSHITLGSQVSDYTFFGNNHVGRFYVTGYAKNKTSSTTAIPGIIVWGGSFGLNTVGDGKDYVFYPTTGSSDSVINKIVITSNKEVNVAIYSKARDALVQDTGKSWLDVLNEWIALGIQLANTIKDFVTSVYQWLKFFFVDNLTMTIALYLTGTLAFAARSFKGRPDRILRQWFSDQKKLYEFIIGLWQSLITIISWFAQIFKLI